MHVLATGDEINHEKWTIFAAPNVIENPRVARPDIANNLAKFLSICASFPHVGREVEASQRRRRGKEETEKLDEVELSGVEASSIKWSSHKRISFGGRSERKVGVDSSNSKLEGRRSVESSEETSHRV